MKSDKSEVALVIGAGPGLGASLARTFGNAGMRIAIASRDASNAQTLAAQVSDATRSEVRGYACDATSETAVDELLGQVSNELSPPNLVVYNASGFLMKSILNLEVDELVREWNVTCLGAFIVGRAAAKCQLAQGGGTLIFTGATACYKGSANFGGFAIGKFGLRALAQSMARELGPKHVHVALVNVDGTINGPEYSEVAPSDIDTLLDPDAIAETYLAIHRQHHSAWTHELDLRPAVEHW